MDKGEYIEALKRAAEAAGKQSGQFMAKSSPEISLAAYTLVLKNPDPFWQHALTTEIVEEKEKAFEIKVTECLWAKTFRDAKAGDIGYATICYQDYAMSQGCRDMIIATIVGFGRGNSLDKVYLRHYFTYIQI